MRVTISNIKKSLLVCLIVMCYQPIFAQEELLPPDDGDPVNAPIDGGVSLLVAAAIGYGAKKAHDSRAKRTRRLQKTP
jgi:hypothetical protein